MMRQCAAFPVVQRFPRPCQHTRVVTGNFQGQIFQAMPTGILQPAPRLFLEKAIKTATAPLLQRGLHPFCGIEVSPQRQFQKLFQIPTQILLQIAIGTTLNGSLFRRDQRNRLGVFAITQTSNDKLRFVVLITDVADLQLCIHKPSRLLPRR